MNASEVTNDVLCERVLGCERINETLWQFPGERGINSTPDFANDLAAAMLLWKACKAAGYVLQLTTFAAGNCCCSAGKPQANHTEAHDHGPTEAAAIASCVKQLVAAGVEFNEE